MSETGKRIKLRRKELGISADQLAEALGVSRSTIFRYEKGDIEKVPAESLQKIATSLNTTPAFLMGWTGESRDINQPDLSTVKNLYPIETRKFPLLGEIACGEPIWADEHFEGYVEAGADIQADFCLRAKGDSMTGARIHDGDIVFIRKQPDVENGEIAAVIIGDEATLKRIDKNVPGVIQLRPENPAFQVKVITLADPDESKSVRIIGKAVAFQGDVK